MQNILSQERFSFLSQEDKAFILAFDAEMNRLGYGFGGAIGSGYCWGKYMIIYTKSGVKSSKSYARVYLREKGIALRFYFSNISAHQAYIEQAPEYIRDAFVRDFGKCSHCHNQKTDGSCRHRKAYTLFHAPREMCDGFTFEFWQVTADRLAEYIRLFLTFYPSAKRRKTA